MGIGNRKITLQFSVNWLIVVFVVAIGLVAAYVFGQPVWRPALIFSTAVLGGAAALTTAINNVDARVSQARQARIIAALEYCSRWNNPELNQAKRNVREILDHFRANTRVEDQLRFLQDDPLRGATLMAIMNTFEALHIAIDNDLVDEQTAKRFFRSLVLEYWHLCEGVIRIRRAERSNPRLYREFEALYSKWKD